MNPTLLSPIHGKNKIVQVSAALVNLARKLGPGAQLPPFRSLCDTLQVAKSTLDHGLGQLEMRGLIERQHGRGMYVTPLVMQKTIGLVMGKNIFMPGVSPLYLELMQKCSARAVASRERFSFYIDIDGVSPRLGSTPVHRDLEEALRIGALDGVILASRNSLRQEEWLRACGIPLVVLGHNSPHLASVDVDNKAIIEAGVDHLNQAGCRSIALLSVWSEDVATFRRVTEERALDCRSEWVLERSAFTNELGGDETEHHEEIGYRAARQLLEVSGKMPEGLVSTDDMLTRGACRAFEEAGFAVGKDIRIATHTNKDSVILREWSEHLVLLQIDAEILVKALFTLLESMMQNTLMGRTVIYIKPELK